MIKPIPPFLFYLIGALLVPFLKGQIKKLYLLIIPTLAFLDLLSMPQGTYWTIKFLDYQLVLGHVDKLSMVFAYVFVIISFAALLYALQAENDVQHFSALYYAGGALGVAFAGDLFTLYIFWELMAIASVFVIWAQRDKEAIRAGFRYVLVHLFGGCALLAFSRYCHLCYSNRFYCFFWTFSPWWSWFLAYSYWFYFKCRCSSFTSLVT